jgi:hypothetical protein
MAGIGDQESAIRKDYGTGLKDGPCKPKKYFAHGYTEDERYPFRGW